MIKYQDPLFLIIVSIQDQVPPELRKRFNVGPPAQGLYCQDIWENGNRKILNLILNSVGATPEIGTCRRCDWEQIFVPPALRVGVLPSWAATLPPKSGAEDDLISRRLTG